MDGHGGRAGRLCRTMRTMVLSTWWALMKRRIGDAMSAGVRERSRASEWVLEREPSAFSLGCLSTCNGCDVYSKSVRSVSTSRCIYLLPSVRMSKSVLNSIPKIENRPSVVRSSLSRRNRLHWRPRARDPTRARQRTRVDPRGRASRPRSESAHTRATGTRARTHADRLPPSPARACRSDAAGALKCRVVFEHVHRGDRLQERGADLGRGGRLPQRGTRVGDRVGLGGTSQRTPTRATIYTRASRQTLFFEAKRPAVQPGSTRAPRPARPTQPRRDRAAPDHDIHPTRDAERRRGGAMEPRRPDGPRGCRHRQRPPRILARI